jgi:hypothetical protein
LGPAQQKAFEELKQYLIDLTTLTPPSSGTPLLLYVAASHVVFSAALVQEKQHGQVKRQAPIYFIFEVLILSKKNYTELEKVLYCHTRVLGVQSPGANINTRCAGTKSHTYDA